jgi:hypothetical protein
MFWKKKKDVLDDLNFDEDFGMNDRPKMPSSEPNFDKPSVSPALAKLSALESPGGTSGDLEKDMQLILAKLDTIQQMLDNLNQRVKNIERIAESE